MDSDWVADYLKGRPEAVGPLNQLLSDGLAVSIITFAEVYEGIYYGHESKRNEAIFRRFLVGVRVLGINRTIAREYARIRGDLRAQGQLVAQSDIFIAATALPYGLTLVTRNVRHFQRIPGLRLYQER